jgi:hypothetical protein
MGCPSPHTTGPYVFRLAEVAAAPRCHGERGAPGYAPTLTPEQKRAKRAERKRERQRRKAAR